MAEHDGGDTTTAVFGYLSCCLGCSIAGDSFAAPGLAEFIGGLVVTAFVAGLFIAVTRWSWQHKVFPGQKNSDNNGGEEHE